MAHNGFVAFGFSADDRGLMNGSYAVIAKAPEKRSQRGEHNLHVAEYSIGGYSESAITRQPTQNLLNPTLTQTGGVTTTGSTSLQFSRLLQTGDAADHVIDRDGANTVVWACGGTNTFRKHMAMGAMHLNWATGEPLPEDAPLEVPIWVFGLIVGLGASVWIAATKSDQKQARLNEKKQAKLEAQREEMREQKMAQVAMLAINVTAPLHGKHHSSHWGAAKALKEEIHHDHAVHESKTEAAVKEHAKSSHALMEMSKSGGGLTCSSELATV
jgi:hypothetical protein